jgi:hypothetical protein
MKAIEAENPELKDVLPKTYGKFETATLASLLKTFGGIPMDVDGDVHGRIYEYFLGNFAPRTCRRAVSSSRPSPSSSASPRWYSPTTVASSTLQER